MTLALPWDTASHCHRRGRNGRQTGKLSGSLTPLCRVRRQGIPRRVLECEHAAPPRPSKCRDCSEMRTSPLFLGSFALALLLLLACAGPDQPTAVPSSERPPPSRQTCPTLNGPLVIRTRRLPSRRRVPREDQGPCPLPPVHRLRRCLPLLAPPKQTGKPWSPSTMPPTALIGGTEVDPIS